MNVVDWFNPCNPVHIAALDYFIKNDMWPEGFLPKGTVPDKIQFHAGWLEDIKEKLALAWIEDRLNCVDYLYKLGYDKMTYRVPKHLEKRFDQLVKVMGEFYEDSIGWLNFKEQFDDEFTTYKVEVKDAVLA